MEAWRPAIVGASEWRRRTAGRRLDALGPQYRVPRQTRARIEELLTVQKAIVSGTGDVND